MEIAIIGWGSLLWDLEILEEHVDPQWHRGIGPVLPLEFSRVSPKRKRALALIIDPDHGTKCATSLVVSRKISLKAAVQDLAARERAPLDRIGFASTSGAWNSTVPNLENPLESWLEASGFNAAVWTDLPRNFEEVTGEVFSITSAIAYLQTLSGEALLEAKRYIELAPEETMTQLRRALSDETWWTQVPLEPAA